MGALITPILQMRKLRPGSLPKVMLLLSPPLPGVFSLAWGCCHSLPFTLLSRTGSGPGSL